MFIIYCQTCSQVPGRPAPLHCITSLITRPRGRGYWTALVDCSTYTATSTTAALVDCSTYTATSTTAEKSAEAFPDPKLQAKNVP